MQSVIHRLVSRSVCAALLALTFSTAAGSAPSGPQLLAGEGTREGGHFTAGAAGAVIGLPGDARLELAPGTSARVFGSDQRLRMPEGYAVSTWSVAVLNGRVTAIVRNPKQAAVLLTASQKFSTVVTRGSTLMMVDQKQYGAANLGGTSHTVSSGRWTQLGEGTLRLFDRAGGKVVTEALLDGVSLLPMKRVWLSPQGKVRLNAFKWQPLKDAKHYVVTLKRHDQLEPLSQLTTLQPELPQPLGPVGPGIYELTVQGVDARGLPGKASGSLRLHVLGLDLPPGAYVTNSGTIHVGAGQNVRFTHAEGLLLTYAGAGQFLPATSNVPMAKNKATLVAIKAPESDELVIARFEPRNIRAEVVMGPATARWPRDRVEVAVELKTDNDSPVPAFIEAHPKVTIGLDPVAVSWRRDGDVLKGTVPASGGKGPWVVRVEVEDQFGLPLGRNLLEVVPAQQQPKPTKKAQASLRVSRAEPIPSR